MHCILEIGLRGWYFKYAMDQFSRKMVFLVLLSLVLSRVASATVIVLACSQTEIVVGADSFFLTNGVEAFQEMPCKIHQEGKMFFALEGQIGSPQSDFVKIVRSAISNAENPKTALELATASLTQALAGGLAAAARNDPAYFKPYSQAGEHLTSLVIFGWNNEHPFIESVEYFTASKDKTREGPTAKVGWESTNLDIPPIGKFLCVNLGKVGAAIPLEGRVTIFGHRILDEPHNIVYWVKSLMEHELSQPVNQADNGKYRYMKPPIDILRITAKKAEWLQKKQECPDLIQYWESATNRNTLR